MTSITRLVLASAVVTGLWTTTAGATPELFMQARKQGMPAQNCQYCHVSPTPQKETYRADDLNARGKWLVTTKNTQQARDVKAEWLGQYPGGKEQQ